MSKTGTALLIKFLMTFVFGIIAFMVFADNPLTWVLWVTLAATAINYLLGDLAVLPRYRNIVASLGDGLLAAVTAYIFDIMTVAFNTGISTLAIFGILVAIGEYIFHQYIARSPQIAP